MNVFNNVPILNLTLEQILKEKRQEIIEIVARHGANNVRIFGSAVRGEATPESDIDLLVDTGSDISSWFPAGLIIDLQELLGWRVEVVTERGLNPFLREHVLREAIPL